MLRCRLRNSVEGQCDIIASGRSEEIRLPIIEDECELRPVPGGRASKVHSSVFLKPVGGIGIRDGVPTYQRALIAAALGEQDEAVRLLNDAVRRGRAVFGLFRHDPEFQALQGYPAYERFMAPKDSPTPPPASPLSPMMLVLALSGLAAVVTAMFLWRKRQPAR